MKAIVEQPRGILNLKAGEKKFQLSRPAPAPDLSFFVEHYWIVNWDLRGQAPYRQENLPHPCVHLVFEQDKLKIYGVMKRKFSRLLEGKGRAFGVKFKPGAFYTFVKTPVAQFTDLVLSGWDGFGVAGQALERTLRPLEAEAELIEVVEQFLRQQLPMQDEQSLLIDRIVARIIADPMIVKVDDVIDQFGLNKRTLQRIFRQYVGASPKWVIKIYRLQEAAEQMAGGDIVDWAKLALDLGYFDQAHFIKDFKAIVGMSPTEYTSSIA